jgi:hypothetical protein
VYHFSVFEFVRLVLWFNIHSTHEKVPYTDKKNVYSAAVRRYVL